MKKNYVRMCLVAMLCLAIPNVQAQGLKGLLDNAKGVVGSVTKKKEAGKTTGKADKNVERATAKPLVSDVKNAVSDIRSLTGLTKADFEKKVKSLGYIKSNDDTGGLVGGGETVYKSKGSYLTVSMGTRGGDSFTRSVTKSIYSKKADLAAMKTNFLTYEKQCTDLKAKFDYASVEEKGKLFGSTKAQSVATRTSKFLPALNAIISANKDFFASDDYSEQDYTYRIIFYNVRELGSAMIQLYVTDNTVDSLEG